MTKETTFGVSYDDIFPHLFATYGEKWKRVCTKLTWDFTRGKYYCWKDCKLKFKNCVRLLYLHTRIPYSFIMASILL